MRNKTKRVVEASIDAFSKSGNGSGEFLRPDGFSGKIEVPYTMPGDRVRAGLFKKKGSTYLSHLEDIIIPSPERIKPRCSHFGSCGGCKFQHIPYTEQLKIKEKFIRDSFGSLITPETIVHPIVPCANPWQYRNKMEFTFSSDAAGNKYLGLIKSASKRRVVNIEECYLTNSWFSDAVNTVRKWWVASRLDAYHPMKDSGSLRNLVLREGLRTGDRMVILTVSGNPDYSLQQSQIDSFISCVRQIVEPTNSSSRLSIFLKVQQIAPGMSTNFYEMHLYGADCIREVLEIQPFADQPPVQLSFRISPGAFFQTNILQAEKVYSLALNLAKVPKDSLVYDLYCGTGSLGICLSKYVKKVIGIEISPDAIADARQNALKNNCKNITFINGAIRNALREDDQDLSPPDLVIIDPPRGGMDPVATENVMRLKPKKFLYISCNPQTQALNAEAFIKMSYKLETLQPVDQFPQTPHVENIMVLSRA